MASYLYPFDGRRTSALFTAVLTARSVVSPAFTKAVHQVGLASPVLRSIPAPFCHDSSCPSRGGSVRTAVCISVNARCMAVIVAAQYALDIEVASINPSSHTTSHHLTGDTPVSIQSASSRCLNSRAG